MMRHSKLYFTGCVLIGVMLSSGCEKRESFVCDELPVNFGDSTTVVGTWALNSSVNGQTGL